MVAKPFLLKCDNSNISCREISSLELSHKKAWRVQRYKKDG